MEIMLPIGGRKALAVEFNVSRITVWKALTGRSNSLKARMIRKVALEKGGKVYEGTMGRAGNAEDIETA
ncbi:hypothetical protein LJC12_02730 [Odoribacter sp. OttesenSCG-928-J03]|nr:hypothetical protein [Odoribacter sp. OttesenSCG-928-J03]MDL2283207.1 hypothetical protein [Odoribacter sp. OttesenSCG-928-G04]